MNKIKLFCVGLLGVALVFGMVIIGCGPTNTWGADDPGLTKLTIAWKTAELGTPNETAASALPGSVKIISKEKNSSGTPIFSNATVVATVADTSTMKVKWAVTDNQTPPAANRYSIRPVNLTDGQFLWVEVSTSAASMYYVIEITITSEASIKNHPASRQYSLTAWGNGKALTVEMEDDDEYEYQWYSNTSFSNTGGSPITGATQYSFTPTNITAAGVHYFYVIVTEVSSGRTLTSQPARISIVADGAISDAPTQFTIGTDRLNYVRGIGGTGSFMFREGSNADPSPDADVNYVDLLCGVLGLNVLRIMVQDDYENYVLNTVQDKKEGAYFHNAKDNFFPVIRKVNEYNGYVYANPWTPPAEMKSNGTLAGKDGDLKKTGPNYVDYAEHLRNFLKMLNENNAPIFALGIQNEPDFSGGTYEGMKLSPDETKNWFRTVGHFTTQRVTNRSSAGIGDNTSIFEEDIIEGWGGGGPTHHVLTMSGDVMGDVSTYMDPQLRDPVANNNIELIGRHYYAGQARYTTVAGNSTTTWFNRPQSFGNGGTYQAPHEAEALGMSPQMYAPGTTLGNVKREVWQTEHDHNYTGQSVNPDSTRPHTYWNSTFAAMNGIDYCLRVVGESVYDWWFSSSYSGFVTSWHTPTKGVSTPYTILPRGRGAAHYARYVNETWLLPISRSRGSISFNTTTTYNAGATDPKISAFEDVGGRFISIVMFTPPRSTSGGAIDGSFGSGGTSVRNDDPGNGSTNVGRIEVKMPTGFTATSATAIRSYGDKLSTGQAWDDQPTGSPRFWIDEPVILSDDGSSVEVTLPGGNIISIKVMGEWTSGNNRHFEYRPTPFDQANADRILNLPQNRHNLTTSGY